MKTSYLAAKSYA